MKHLQTTRLTDALGGMSYVSRSVSAEIYCLYVDMITFRQAKI